MIKSDIARKYRKRFPKTPSLSLARKMYNDNVSVFRDVEDARSRLRYIEGKIGVAQRKNVIKTEFFEKEDRPRNPFNLPESWSEERKVFKIATGCNKIGFLSDFQVPFHDVQAIKTACKWLKEKGVNTIFINSDFVDFYGLSSFIKDPRKRDFKAELDTAKTVLKWLRAEFPTQTIYYNLDGNHERRYERYMMVKAPELMDIANFDLVDVLELSTHKIIPIKGYDRVEIGKLICVHGDTVFRGFGSPVSKARTVWMKTKSSCIASHVHQTDEYNTKDIAGKLFTCWTTGCLMSLNVEYNPHGNEYNHGFAYIETDRNGDYSVENKRIYNGKVL